ncbi:MAG: S8 family peptidase [Flammeovirgaceae bacterium]
MTSRKFISAISAVLLPFSFAFADASYPVVFQDTTKRNQEPPLNWHHLDIAQHGFYGVSTEKAYEYLKSKNAKPKEVVVAVIDSGIDTEHEDLKEVIWKNPKEIAGNGKDDDGNGYEDDIFGWNFIGGKDGSHVNHDTYEATRLYKKYSAKFSGKQASEIPADQKTEYELFLKVKEKYESKALEIMENYEGYKNFYEGLKRAKKLMEAYFGMENVPMDSIKSLQSPDFVIQRFQGLIMFAEMNGLDEANILEAMDYYKNSLEYGYNPDFEPRKIVGDDYFNFKDKFYGNADVKGPDAKHGTHVAGIIAASRNNSKGMDGIADNVKIMVLRAVPNGDERDKDIANAIYYAVDNGAKVINMSFGKNFSPEKELVDAAVKYAESKGVLLVHAAGNSSLNTDIEENFPKKQYLNDKKSANNWIEVGALSWRNGDKMVAKFSNYGKKSVDIFSPGVDIYSTTPESKYEQLSGTSMAAPVTAGIAAMILSYYPELSANQVKECILKSAIKLKGQKVIKPAEEGTDVVDFAELSETGGIVNAFEAIKMAEVMSKKLKKNK